MSINEAMQRAGAPEYLEEFWNFRFSVSYNWPVFWNKTSFKTMDEQ
jgi:hypothetical protein